MSEQLATITTLQQLKELQTLIRDVEFIAYDTETNGVDKESHIIGMSIATDCETGYYIVTAYWDVQEQKLVFIETVDGIKEFLEVLKTKKLIMHNGPFDCAMTFNNFGVQLIDSLHTDTMIAGHLLNENRRNGLKELSVSLFGEDSKKEQLEMKESVTRNGGQLTKECYELYKGDWELIAKYGAKDAILTMKLFGVFVEQLFEEGLDKFFYDDESMPLLRGPTYDLNTTGLRVDPVKLQQLRGSLETECMEAKAFIEAEVYEDVREKYPGTGETNHFNINATQQLSWLLFDKLGNEFRVLTKAGREMCRKLHIKIPYAPSDKRAFIAEIKARKGEVYAKAYTDSKGKKHREKKIEDYWKYLSCGKESLTKYSKRYKWAERLLAYKKADKLLGTYVIGIQERMTDYNVIRPSFLQHGTTSGRYSSKEPNFQNLPRDDKRVKACIVSRPEKVFVGADYSQLEPRIFASYSGDKRLLECFKTGDDFYSVVGAEVFNISGCSMKKDDKNSFAKRYPELRNASKTFALAAAYGTTAFKMAPSLGKTTDDAREIIQNYFHSFPGVRDRMLLSHQIVKKEGRVTNLYGRPRRLPEALNIPKDKKHEDLEYDQRNILNQAMNSPIQSTAASIMNRAAIAVCNERRRLSESDKRWKEVKVVLQVHDELVLEGPEELGDAMSIVLKNAMENTCELPGVALIAEPKIAYNLADLK